jgi:hypothetical protein
MFAKLDVTVDVRHIWIDLHQLLAIASPVSRPQ